MYSEAVPLVCSIYTMSFLHSHTITLETPLPTSTAKHIQTSIYIQYTASSSSLKKCQERPQHTREPWGLIGRRVRLLSWGRWGRAMAGEDCMKNVQTVDTYLYTRLSTIKIQLLGHPVHWVKYTNAKLRPQSGWCYPKTWDRFPSTTGGNHFRGLRAWTPWEWSPNSVRTSPSAQATYLLT